MTTNENDSAKMWEGAEGHRFALEVLQLPLRRRILRIIASGIKSTDQIERELGISSTLAAYHLAMLEKALVIERYEGDWRATSTGQLYLDKVEAGR
ncbi:MAG: winged helix-turn-helix domain-containing protein [Methanothrix sp.]|nr:winged helix-turn-helix domain-containing protein [Methanothrix sp.]